MDEYTKPPLRQSDPLLGNEESTGNTTPFEVPTHDHISRRAEVPQSSLSESSAPASSGAAHEAGRQVATAAQDGAGDVAQEAKRQAQDLFRNAQAEAGEQAASQKERMAGGLRSISNELDTMAARSEQGIASDLASQAASTTGELAFWLEQRDPADVLDEIRSFARRRPGMFLALSAAAGVLAGRLTRGLAADEAKPDSSRGSEPYADVSRVSRADGEGRQVTSPYHSVPASDLAR